MSLAKEILLNVAVILFIGAISAGARHLTTGKCDAPHHGLVSEAHAHGRTP